jgi:hypothetical protein
MVQASGRPVRAGLSQVATAVKLNDLAAASIAPAACSNSTTPGLELRLQRQGETLRRRPHRRLGCSLLGQGGLRKR